MEEDVLSDVVPSNIVSRQVKLGFVDYSQAQYLSSASQESEGGESEYDDEAADEMEVDELQSEGEKASLFSFCMAYTPRHVQPRLRSRVFFQVVHGLLSICAVAGDGRVFRVGSGRDGHLLTV